MTHNELASTIRNRVADGLSGNIVDQAFSLEQLLEEIDLQRADFVHKYAESNKLDIKYLVQELSAVEIVCRDILTTDPCFDLVSGDNVPSIKIPKLLSIFGDKAIQYVGLTNMQENFAVYFSPEDIQNHQVRIRTKHRPFIWVDTAPDVNDDLTLWFFNFGSYNPLKYIKVRGVFEHPTRVNVNNPLNLDNEYPAPLHMQNSIVDALTEKYVRYYRQLNIPPIPNTQSDPIT